jgi:hypothetical protein
MARVNVYLPDDLALEVREADLAVSTICQKALREELSKMMLTKTDYEVLTVEVGDPVHEEQFRGRWLVVPDPDSTRSGEPGVDAGTFYGVAQTAKGRIAVTVAHCNDRFAPQLRVYDSIDDVAEKQGLPSDIEAEARGALGIAIWRDI